MSYWTEIQSSPKETYIFDRSISFGDTSKPGDMHHFCNAPGNNMQKSPSKIGRIIKTIGRSVTQEHQGKRRH